MVAVNVVVIGQYLRPVRGDIGVGAAHGLLLVITFLGVTRDSDAPRWAGRGVLNRG